MTTAAQAEPAGHPVPRGLVLTLVFIGLVVAAIGSLGAPLIPSVAPHSNVSLGAAQWTLTITLLTGALATPVLARMGAGPHRRRVILFTLITVVAGSIVTVLPVGFAGLLAGRGLQGIGVGLTSLVIGVARVSGHRPGPRIRRQPRAVRHVGLKSTFAEAVMANEGKGESDDKELRAACDRLGMGRPRHGTENRGQVAARPVTRRPRPEGIQGRC
jgi:predicted MFS family arabinose efflux permease